MNKIHTETEAAVIRAKNARLSKVANKERARRRKKLHDMKLAKELGLTYEEVAGL